MLVCVYVEVCVCECVRCIRVCVSVSVTDQRSSLQPEALWWKLFRVEIVYGGIVVVQKARGGTSGRKHGHGLR